MIATERLMAALLIGLLIVIGSAGALTQTTGGQTPEFVDPRQAPGLEDNARIEKERLAVDEERRRLSEEAEALRRKVEETQAKAEEERRRLAKEAEELRKAAAEAKERAEAEANRLKEERAKAEAQREREAEARLAAEEAAEKARLAAEEEAARTRAEAAAEAKRLAEEAAEKARLEVEEEAARKRAEAAAEARRQAEEAAEKARLEAEEEAARKRAEAEAEARRQAEQAAERARLAAEEEAARKRAEAEAEARRQAEEAAEKARIAAEKEAARKRAEAEAKRLAEEAAEKARIAAEEEAARKRAEAEAEAKRQADEAAEKARLEAEAEAARKRAEAEKSCTAEQLPELKSSVEPGGRLSLAILAPCRQGQPVTVAYGPYAFATRLDGAGQANFMLDLFLGTQTSLTLILDDGSKLPITLPSVDLSGISKVSIVWKAPINLDLHALEYLAAPASDGHVWAGTPSSFENARALSASAKGHGFMSSIAGADQAGDKVEAYTFVHAAGQRSGVVTTFVDYETRGDVPNGELCEKGQLAAVSFDVIELSPRGEVNVEKRRLSPAACGRRLARSDRFNPDTIDDLQIRQ